jgi:Ca2+-transporting ATPase
MSKGLSQEAAQRLLQEVGPNEIQREKSTPPWKIFIRQFTSPMVGLLAIASGVALALGERVDAVAILVIVALNAMIGFFQEYRAEKAVLALRAMTAPRARVLRDGHAALIPAQAVVPGDILLLEAGDRVAADAQVMEVHQLLANESALTGESVPVEKDPAPLGDDVPLAERKDHVYAGTAIVGEPGWPMFLPLGCRRSLERLPGC